MFKSVTRKTLAMICITGLLLSYPVSLSANVGNTAAFTFFGMDNTTVAPGQTITFTIRTTGANFVFADVGGEQIPGTRREMPGPPTGQVTWELSVRPPMTQQIFVYANTINAVEGAAVVTIPVTVNAPVALQPQPVPVAPQPQQPAHRIDSITEIQATQANTVSLRIVTDNAAGYVWIAAEPGRYMQATRVSPNTWEVTYRPTSFTPHQIQVSANHAYIVDQSVATQSFSVVLAHPFVPPVLPSIGRASANPSTIDSGGRATITVRTNTDVQYVWATVDGTRVNATRGAATGTNLNWTVEVSPDRSQDIRIFANTTNTEEGASQDRVRVTVRDEVREARVTSASLRNSHIFSGERTTIDVRTTADARYVWAILNNGHRVDGRRRDSSAAGTGDRDWVIDVNPNETQTIRVYASSASDRTQDAEDHRTVHVTVDTRHHGWPQW